MARVRILVGLLSAGCAIGLLTMAWYELSLRAVYRGDSPQRAAVFAIRSGDGASAVGRHLREQSLVRSGLAFDLLARRTGLASRLQAGTYRVSPAESSRRILARFVKGDVADTVVTIPEGWTARQIAARLQARGVIAEEKAFLSLVAARQLEGRLFPDTYRIPIGLQPPADVAQRLVTRFYERAEQELGLATLARGDFSDVLILASLVEREAKVEKDRPLVASVFSNRLRIGQKLESCATVVYALGGRREALSYQDLEIESPYNTYIHEGLPPGPICNPGIASLRAAAHPAKTDYLYFVLGSDGRHVFSRDFASHVSAAAQTQGRLP